MVVYVDKLRNCKPTKKQKNKSICHLLADTVDELHTFAKKLGLKREWFQDGLLPHYDISYSKRGVAKKLGAKEASLLKVTELLARKD